MKNTLVQSILFAMLFVFCVNTAIADESVLDLAGMWKFRLDADGVGVKEKWYTQELEDSVKLPGTTDENHKGVYKNESDE
jgi:hypothetical protein